MSSPSADAFNRARPEIRAAVRMGVSLWTALEYVTYGTFAARQPGNMAEAVAYAAPMFLGRKRSAVERLHSALKTGHLAATGVGTGAAGREEIPAADWRNYVPDWSGSWLNDAEGRTVWREVEIFDQDLTAWLAPQDAPTKAGRKGHGLPVYEDRAQAVYRALARLDAGEARGAPRLAREEYRPETAKHFDESGVRSVQDWIGRIQKTARDTGVSALVLCAQRMKKAGFRIPQ